MQVFKNSTDKPMLACPSVSMYHETKLYMNSKMSGNMYTCVEVPSHIPALLACIHMRQATGAVPFGRGAGSALPCCMSCQLAADCALSGKRMSNPGQCMTNTACLLSTRPAFTCNVGAADNTQCLC